METILFLAPVVSSDDFSRSALEGLAVASDLAARLEGARFVVGLFGDAVGPAADRIAGCGAARFLGIEGAEFASPRYASDSVAAEALARQSGATIVVAPGSSRIARVLSGVGHRLGGRTDTHVTGIEIENGALSIRRWYYRQRMEAVMRRTRRPWVIGLEPGAVPPWSGEAGAAGLERVAVDLERDRRRTTVTGLEAPPADEQTIRPDADVLLVAGAGWTKRQPDGVTHLEEAEKLILGFLRRMRASLGSSKSLVDLSSEGQKVLPFMTHLNQVGQTGSTPRHPKGLATCCHGEEPHVVGWRFVNERRAVNLDPNCGWARGKADVLYVADAFKVLARVNELLGDG